MKLDQFPGLNTATNIYELGLSGLAQAQNIDISRNGSISRRPGRTKVYTGVIDAAWSDKHGFLFVEENELKQLNSDYSATSLATLDFTSTTLYGMRSSMGWLYWSTGIEHGVIVDGVNRAWSTAEDNYWSGTDDESVIVHELYTDPMPVGKQMVEFAGRIWVVYDTMLIYTDPFSELTDLRENFIPLGGRITNLGFVSDGLFVTTEAYSYFLRGTDPDTIVVERRAPFGAIADTMIQVDGRVLGEGQNTLGLLWASSDGICGGLPNGTLVNITKDQIKELSGIKGSALLRELNGQRHYIAVLQN